MIDQEMLQEQAKLLLTAVKQSPYCKTLSEDDQHQLCMEMLEALTWNDHGAGFIEEVFNARKLHDEIDRLRTALMRLLDDGVYKEHAKAAKMASDVLNRSLPPQSSRFVLMAERDEYKAECERLRMAQQPQGPVL
jgi:hypothetical protein